MLSLDKPLVIDVDDVTLDWLMGGFRPYVESQTGTTLCANGPDGWNMAAWTGRDYDTTMDMIRAFNASTDFGKLPAFDCALTVLPQVAKSGRRIHVVTSCARAPEVHQLREENLHRYFGDVFASITCLDIGESKAERLAEIAEQEGLGVWMEDNYKNAVIGADMGYTTFAFRRSHNRAFEAENTHPNITWVDTWHDVAPVLL